MKILSVRRGFASDHSSTSYEFLAVDKPLSKKERAEVSKLSSRVHPTARRAGFVYHVDGYNIPGGWEKLMARYYDVMYSEDYDWWTLAIAFNADLGQYEDLRSYEFDGVHEGTGIGIAIHGQRIIITIYCSIEMGKEYDYYYEDMGDDEDEENDESSAIATDDKLLNVLAQVRRQIIGGDYSALYAVWEKYGDADDEVSPPKPKSVKADDGIVDTFKNMLGYRE
jgi:hypothetical protein